MSETISFFSRGADEFLSQYLRDPDFRERFGLWAVLLERHAAGRLNAYDIGCGPGLFSRYLGRLGLDVIGIDGSAEMIALAKGSACPANVSFIQAELPLRGLSLPPADIIVCSSVLEYIDGLDEVLSSFHDLLNPGGLLLFSLPNAEGLHRRYERLRFRLTGTPAYLRHVRNTMSLDQAGELLRGRFSLLESYYYGRGPALSRLASLVAPPRFSDNLFLAVCRKS